MIFRKVNKSVLFFSMYCICSCTNFNNKAIQDKQSSNDERSSLMLRLESSDSVLLISHEPTYRIARDTPLGVDSVQLLEKGILNKKIVREMIRINNYDELLEILFTKNKDSIITRYNCFIPHHAVIVYFKNKIDYLDICFLCKTIETSKNSIFSQIDMANKTFDLLESFFQKNGIKYFPKLED